MTPNCASCTILLDKDNCYPSDWKNGKGGGICKNCRKLKFNKIDPIKKKFYDLKKRFLIKQEIINTYGKKCQCCGEENWQFLTIDHIDNWGAEHRKNEIGRRGGTAIYRWLKSNNFPKDRFRLLCMNCNACIGFHGFCGHSLEKNKLNCSGCNIVLNNENQFKFHQLNGSSLCKLCILDMSIKHDAEDKIICNKNLLQRRKEGKAKSLKIRLLLILGYGGRCECCQEDDFMFLVIDHINNDGAADKIKFGAPYKFYRYLINNNFPKDKYRLLCHNCNAARQAYGECYHVLKKENNKDISIDEYIASHKHF